MKRSSHLLAALGLVAGLLKATPAQATIIYVDKDNACPGTGTSANPYCGLQFAFSVVSPGDAIRIRDSATPYDETATATRSGTAAAPITVEADTGNHPILRYTGNGAMAAVIRLANVNYWTIQNLTFDGTGVYTSEFAIWVAGDNWFAGVNGDQLGIQIIGNTFRNWGKDSGASHDGYSEYYTIHVGGGWGPPSPSSYLPNGTIIRGNVFDGSRNVALSMTSSKNAIVEDNEIKNLVCGTYNDGSGGTALAWVGIHIISGTTGVGTGDLYRNNTFHDYDLTCGLSQSAGSYTQMSAIHADEGPASGSIVGNTIWNLDSANTTVSAIAIFIELRCHGWMVRNNVVANVGVSGIRHNPQSAGAASTYLNNSIYNTGWRGLEFYSGNAVVKNNISYNGLSSQIYVSANAVTQGNLTIDYNNYVDKSGGTKVGRYGANTLTLAGWQAACLCDAHSLTTDPLFVNPPLDFHLQVTSPARNSGEGGVNMGAFVLNPPNNLRIVP